MWVVLATGLALIHVDPQPLVSLCHLNFMTTTTTPSIISSMHVQLLARMIFVLAQVLLLHSVTLVQAASQEILSPQSPVPEVHRWAALGDSYAAGLGAGSRLKTWTSYGCSRYNASYPYLLHTHPIFNSSSEFQYHACSGATTTDVLNNQLTKLSAESKDPKDPKVSKYDLITLSAGGNDVHLADVLNACIFQWSGGDDAACEKQLNTTSHAISTELGPALDKLHAKLIPLLSPGAKIYQTGYARFFDLSSHPCDNVTWAFWYSGLGWWQKQYLTVERRTRMNDLALATNRAIEDAAKRAGEQVVYVSFDMQFEEAQGLFCEPGVEEPMPNRVGLLFYEWNTKDSPDDHFNGNETVGAAQGSFEQRVEGWVREGRGRSPDAVSMAVLEAEQQGISTQSTGVVPDGYKRVFHPRPAGHAIMAERILRSLGAPVALEEDRLELR